MKKKILLFEPRKLGVRLTGCKNFAQFFGVFVFLVVCLFSFSSVAANDFEQNLKDLGNKSRSKIKKAVKNLGNQGNPSALPALEALKDNRLRVSEEGALIILNKSGEEGRDALTEKQVDIKSLDLRKPRINNSVRRALSATIGKLQLQSTDIDIRLAAAKQLLKKSSSGLVELVEKALSKETNDEIRAVFNLVLAKEELNSDDKQKRLASLKIIREFGSNDFKSVLESLLKKNDKDEFLESDSEIRDSAVKALSSIERRQFFINQIANLFYGMSLGSICF